MNQPLRPRGTRDWRGPELEAHRHVEATCERVFASFGCEPVRPPAFEDYTLLESRYGAAIRERLFTFHADREYALRPDLTGSVARMAADGALGAPPHRLSYVGSCWRYERSQELRWREFRQAGVELVGAPAGAADRELLDCALAVLEAVGVEQVQVRLGHAGLLAGWLASRPDTADHAARLLADMDALDRVAVRAADADPQWLAAKWADVAARQRVALRFGPDALPDRLRVEGLPPEDAASGSTLLLEAARETTRALWVRELGLGGAVVERLLGLVAVGTTAAQVEAVLGDAKDVAAVRDGLGELHRLEASLPARWRERVELAPGSARGLAYYTGLTFEIEAPAFGGQKQLCGGGRFDRMIADVGGPSLPAAGFAFGVERLAAAMVRERGAVPGRRMVWVAAADDAAREDAARVAAELRRQGVGVVTDLVGVSLAEQLGRASADGARAAVLVGGPGGLAVRWLDERRHQAVGRAALAAVLEAGPEEAP